MRTRLIKFSVLDFHARERGNNKKQATAVCALAMIRQLYKEGLVEKHGDPIKHPMKKQQSKDPEKKSEQLNSGSLKRKADEVLVFACWFTKLFYGCNDFN